MLKLFFSFEVDKWLVGLQSWVCNLSSTFLLRYVHPIIVKWSVISSYCILPALIYFPHLLFLFYNLLHPFNSFSRLAMHFTYSHVCSHIYTQVNLHCSDACLHKCLHTIFLWDILYPSYHPLYFNLI